MGKVKHSKTNHFLILLIFVIFCSFSGHQQVNKKELYFNKKYVDFGCINNDTLLIADFWLKNKSNKTMEIVNIDPDCICTNYEFENYSIAPLDSSLLKLYFDTKDKIGKYITYIIIEAETKTRFYKLTLKVDIQK